MFYNYFHWISIEGSHEIGWNGNQESRKNFNKTMRRVKQLHSEILIQGHL